MFQHLDTAESKLLGDKETLLSFKMTKIISWLHFQHFTFDVFKSECIVVATVQCFNFIFGPVLDF